MKRLKYLVLSFAFVLVSFAASAENMDKAKNPKDRAEQIERRVNEIWKMDFSDMDKAEKSEIRKELKSIKKEMKQTGLDSKISISIGAVIIILLIIIIIA